MRICLLLPSLSPSGGIAVALGHARRLAATPGVQVEVALTEAEPDAGGGGLELPLLALEQAARREYDVAIATWWATGMALYSLNAARRVVFLQSFEERFYREWDAFDRIGAGSVLGLPADFIVVADWMRALVEELRPDASCRVVRNGIDKEVFATRSAGPRNGPLKVLVEGQPTLWFKGVEQAVEAVRGMEEPSTLTLAALDPGAAGELGADRVVGNLDPSEMADLYADHDVLLKLSRVESLGLPAIEALHVGTPCVVTPYTGHEEYIRHGENGIVVGFDDPPGTAGWLDRLARDRGLLERLRKGALATAAKWPDTKTSNNEFAAALRSLMAEERRPNPNAAARRLTLDLQLQIAMGRQRALRSGWNSEELGRAWAELAELHESRDPLVQQLQDANRRLDLLTSSPAHLARAAGRRLLGKVRG